MTFVNAVSKTRYDVAHKTMKIKSKEMIYFKLHQKYTISSLFNRKLSNQKVDSFKIIEIINKNE